jgi:hypothetical protein
MMVYAFFLSGAVRLRKSGLSRSATPSSAGYTKSRYMHDSRFMPGLEPGIQTQKIYVEALRLDGRVKPGHVEGG